LRLRHEQSLRAREDEAVSSEEDGRHMVRNKQNQPVELHLPSGVKVLLPGETTEVPDAELAAAPQVQALHKARLIATERLAGPASDAAPDLREETPEPEEASGDAETPPGTPARARRRGTTRQRM
jgi:hypothetical protein